MATWRSGYAAACKAVDASSNLAVASKINDKSTKLMLLKKNMSKRMLNK